MPAANSYLVFYSRLTYATPYQTAKVEVSIDGGKIWRAIWAQNGRNNAGERAFSRKIVRLGAFAGREISVRFNYDLRFGSAFTQTASGVGWYVDYIYATNTQKLAGTVYSGITPAPQYNLTPVKGATYALQVRPLVYGQYWLGWSAITNVTAR